MPARPSATGPSARAGGGPRPTAWGPTGTRASSTFDGRCVKTIVFSRPMRSASQPAAIDEPAWSRPTPKKTRPITSAVAPKRRPNQKTMNDCTMNPPANASSAKRPAEAADGRARPIEPEPPLPRGPRHRSRHDALRPRARRAHATAPTGMSRSQRWSGGRPGSTARSAFGPPAASAPAAPARYATAL